MNAYWLKWYDDVSEYMVGSEELFLDEAFRNNFFGPPDENYFADIVILDEDDKADLQEYVTHEIDLDKYTYILSNLRGDDIPE